MQSVELVHFIGKTYIHQIPPTETRHRQWTAGIDRV